VISRHWRGTTKPGQDEAYIAHLKAHTFPRIGAIPGFVSASILKQDGAAGTEFEIVTVWQSRAAIEAFAGQDIEAAVVPEAAQALLAKYDQRVRHFEIVDNVTKSGVDKTARNLRSISPFFIVKDLPTSIAYYRDRLGFQVDFQGPPDDEYYAGVSREGAAIMLKTITPDVLPQPNHTRHEWARWDAYIYTLDPDALFEEFSRRGATFVKPLSFIDDGLWGFEINDADGYVIAFFRLRDKSA
jgi:heme-degrading monooxygenase HmoA/catechol 2,3-dioxygenase-like lactoylglutathione lyase family enzyme